jgi:hypothetical protein
MFNNGNVHIVKNIPVDLIRLVHMKLLEYSEDKMSDTSLKAHARDIVIELVHNRFCTRVQVWVKMQDGVGGWVSSAIFQQ